MKTRNIHISREGGILAVVMIVLLAFSIIVLSLFHLSYYSARETIHEEQTGQAFWLAEAGVEVAIADLYNNGTGEIGETAAGLNISGTYEVVKDPGDENRRIAIGREIIGERTVTRRILVELAFVASPFENAIYGGNSIGAEWTLRLNGTQKNGRNGPVLPGRGRTPGGNDVVRGDVDVNGDVRLDDQSKVTVPYPNNYGVTGDVDASGTVTKAGGASISGSVNQTGSGDYDPPDLAAMKYEEICNFDIAAIFDEAERAGNVSHGRLNADTYPFLHDVVVKNVHPSGDPTPGVDDYYFEPTSIVVGSKATGETPLILGDDKIYYVDGHVWFHHPRTYGFEVDGTAVIASTYDIHISDNINYQNKGSEEIGGNPPDMLALVAVGQYTGNVRNGYGDVYFGDPKYGTLYSCDAFMFANNNFLYNTSSDTGGQGEPESGFKVFGNFMAVNNVVVLRDWYTKDGNRRAAKYVYEDFDGDGSKEWNWVDALDYQSNTITALSKSQIDEIRHYAMEVGYDDRIRNAATQMQGLPRGNGTIFAGIKSWKEI